MGQAHSRRSISIRRGGEVDAEAYIELVRQRDLEAGLERELQFHLDKRVGDLRQSGLSEIEAIRQARIELGGATQIREEVRDVWLSRWLRDLVSDLRFSGRSFQRSPSFAAAVVVSLALGIGATAAIYSLVDQIVLRAIPVQQPHQLVLVDWKGDQVASGMGSYNLMSYPICLDLQKQDRIFAGVLCRAATTVNLSIGGDAKPVAAEIVSGSYFATLGIGAALGRVIGVADDQQTGADPVIVLSYDYWKNQLAGSADIVERKVMVNKSR